MVAESVDEARRALAGGRPVVLVLAPGADPLPDDLRASGLVAVMVGDPADAAVLGAARLMDEELFPTAERSASRRSGR